MSTNSLQQLLSLGQSAWYDNISRDLIRGGKLANLINNYSVRGLTSNPTIFDNAIGSSDMYDTQIEALRPGGHLADEIFEKIALQDISEAADALLNVYESSNGDDGFVSIEVSPLLASDTEGTVSQARRLYDTLARPNIMIKVPGTSEGLPAVRSLLEEGINVNITLLFSVENYEAVARSYCEALEARLEKGLPVDKIRSVASFFVSRVDAAVDKRLEEIGNSSNAEVSSRISDLLGRFAIANSKMAYASFKEIFYGERFSVLKSKGAAVQRPLWASTSTKNATYRDVMYVEQLIGPDTVNTLPQVTLDAFADHGVAAFTIEDDIDDCFALSRELVSLGVDVKGILADLQVEGVKKFVDSFVALNETIEKKLNS